MRQQPVEVAKHIYIGSRPSESDLAELKSQGFTAVLTIMESLEGTSMIERCTQELDMEWAEVPIKDSFYHGVPTSDQIKEAVKILARWSKEGHRIFIHCQEAVGRSPLIVIAYRCLQESERLVAAISAVKQAWPRSDPNSKQIGALCELL